MESCFCIVLLLSTFSAFAASLDEQQHLIFELDGAMYDETVDVREDIVILTDVYEGFVVILDYHRNLMTIKNTTSQTCFFSRLEKDHFKENDVTPVLVTEVPKDYVMEPAEPDVDVIVLSVSEGIPTDFALLTTDVIVAEQCTGLPSYWLVGENARRERPDFMAAAKRWPKIKIKICIKIEWNK